MASELELKTLYFYSFLQRLWLADTQKIKELDLLGTVNMEISAPVTHTSSPPPQSQRIQRLDILFLKTGEIKRNIVLFAPH
jgi:hypothetical protein